MWVASPVPISDLLWEYQTSVEAGLRYRPLAQTVLDTRSWHQSLSPEQQKFTRAGISADKEQQVLAALAQT